MPRAKRSEFSEKTKLAAFERAAGKCECGCGKPLLRPEYHHIVPAFLEGEGSNDLSNCKCINRTCHEKETALQRPEITRTKRLEKKRLGLLPKRRGFAKPPPRYNPWTRRIEGED